MYKYLFKIYKSDLHNFLTFQWKPLEIPQEIKEVIYFFESSRKTDNILGIQEKQIVKTIGLRGPRVCLGGMS